MPERIPDRKDEKECAAACNGTQQISKETDPDESKSLMTNGHNNQSVAFNDVKDVTVKGETLTDAKPASMTVVDFSTLSTSVGQTASLLGEQVASSNAGTVKDELEMATDTKVKAEKRPQPANFHSDSEEKPSKKARNDDVNKSSFDKSRNYSQKLVERGNDVKTMSTAADVPAEKAKSGNDGPIRQEKDKPFKQGKVDCPSKEKNINNMEKVIFYSDLNCAKKKVLLFGTSYGEITKSKVTTDSMDCRVPPIKRSLVIRRRVFQVVSCQKGLLQMLDARSEKLMARSLM